MPRAVFGRRAKSPSGSSAFIERRSCSRRRVFNPARIVVDGGSMVADCVIRDISDTGAGLRLASPATLPHRFLLEREAEGGQVCRVVWQSGFDAGVAFEHAAV